MPENPTELLAKILDRLNAIERHLAPPPLWKRALSFFFSHFFQILSLLVLLYFVFRIWTVLGGISGSVESLGEKFSGFSDGMRFWK